MNKRGIATALVLAIIFGLTTVGLGTYIVYDNVKTGNSNAATTVKTSEITNQNRETIDTNSVSINELVTTIKENKEDDYVCSIPKINIKSHDVEVINNEVNYKYIVNCSGQFSSQGYKVFKNDNILSLLIYVYYDGGMHKYASYNIDIKTGEKLENYDLLKIKNIVNTNSDYIKTNLTSTFESLEKNNSNWKGSEWVESVYNDNIAKLKGTNYDEYNMFLSDNGDLNIIFEMYTVAGSGHTYNIINLTKSKYFELN